MASRKLSMAFAVARLVQPAWSQGVDCHVSPFEIVVENTTSQTIRIGAEDAQEVLSPGACWRVNADPKDADSRTGSTGRTARR